MRGRESKSKRSCERILFACGRMDVTTLETGDKRKEWMQQDDAASLPYPMPASHACQRLCSSADNRLSTRTNCMQ